MLITKNIKEKFVNRAKSQIVVSTKERMGFTIHAPFSLNTIRVLTLTIFYYRDTKINVISLTFVEFFNVYFQIINFLFFFLIYN